MFVPQSPKFHLNEMVKAALKVDGFFVDVSHFLLSIESRILGSCDDKKKRMMDRIFSGRNCVARRINFKCILTLKH